MSEALLSIGQTILFLGGLCVALSLVAWLVAMGTYIIYVTREK